MKNITIKKQHLIGKGGTANVYRVDDDKLLKLYNSNHSLDEIKRQKDTDRAAFVIGVPCAISYDIVSCDGSYGILYETLQGNTILESIKLFPKQKEKYIKRYASLLCEMHKIKVQDPVFCDKKKQLLEKIQILSSYITEQEFSQIHDMVINMPEQNTFVHGDYNLNNVILTADSDETLSIDLADCGFMHPILDLSTVYLWLIDMASFGEEFLIANTSLSIDDAKSMWSVFFHEYFKNYPNEKQISLDAIEKNIETHAALGFCILSALMHESMNGPDNVAQLVREKLIPLLNSGCGHIIF